MVGVNKNVCGFVSQFFTFTVFLFQQAITLEQNVRFQCLMAYNTRDDVLFLLVCTTYIYKISPEVLFLRLGHK